MAHRVSIATVAVLGIGALVGSTVALALYLGLSSAADNTRSLLNEQVDDFIDTVALRISDRLEPVLAQADWIAERVESGTVDLGDTESLDTFIVGALSATPQVAGIAIVYPDGHSRRWGREGLEITEEDWSLRPGIMEWLAFGKTATAPAWRQPFWTYTLQAYVLLHDVALRRDGHFLGMFGQVVPISDLSATLVDLTKGTEFVPFVLYDKEQVLAHPKLVTHPDIVFNFPITADQPLKRLNEFDDPVLTRIWSPDSDSVFMLPELARTSAATVEVGEREYAFLYRDIDQFGPRSWTIGVYFDVEAGDNTVFERLYLAAVGGFVVLALSVLVAVWLGRRLSQPVQAIADVAHNVSEGRLVDARSLPSSLVREFDEANRSINGMVTGLMERETIRDTLGRYVPEQVAKNLLSAGGELEVESAEATVLFCDIEGFTVLTEQLGPQRIVSVLNAFFSSMVAILEQYDGVVTQFQGDAILAVFNIPVSNPKHSQNALEAATSMVKAVREQTFEGCRLDIRIGINTGMVVAGAVGAAGRLSYTVHGDAVNLASRLESLNKEYGTRILVAGSTAAQAHEFTLEPKGRIAVRGQSTEIEIFALHVDQ